MILGGKLKKLLLAKSLITFFPSVWTFQSFIATLKEWYNILEVSYSAGYLGNINDGTAYCLRLRASSAKALEK
jgi:hypothetical protein